MLLIWKFRSGDSNALARIYEDHRKTLLRVAAGLLNQTSAAEDVVHDVFLQLARRRTRPGLWQPRFSGDLRGEPGARPRSKTTHSGTTPGGAAGRRQAQNRNSGSAGAAEAQRCRRSSYEQQEVIVLRRRRSSGVRNRKTFPSTRFRADRCGLDQAASLLDGKSVRPTGKSSSS
jgi:hypothetical protein